MGVGISKEFVGQAVDQEENPDAHHDVQIHQHRFLTVLVSPPMMMAVTLVSFLCVYLGGVPLNQLTTSSVRVRAFTHVRHRVKEHVAEQPTQRKTEQHMN